jgi:hypothetical protein
MLMFWIAVPIIIAGLLGLGIALPLHLAANEDQRDARERASKSECLARLQAPYAKEEDRYG